MANTGNKKVRKVKGLGTVYFDNSKNQWVGQIEIGKYDNGRTKFKKLYSDGQNSVIEKMKQFVSAHPNSSISVENVLREGSNILVKDYILSFLLTVKKLQVKPSSYTRNYQSYKNHIVPNIGNYKLADLNAPIIQTELINKMLDKGLSFSSIHKVYVLLNESLRHAFKQKLIPNNPCEFVEEPSKKVTPSVKEIRFFDDDEIERFMNSALLKNANETYHYKNGLAIASVIYTGLRVGELLTLKWSDVDFNSNYLKIHSNSIAIYDDHNIRKIIIQDSTKTKKSRIVHLTKTAKQLFQEMYNYFNPRQDDYVFHVQSGRDINRAINTYTYICKRAKIENYQGMHTLRHTFASLLIRKGVDIKIISEMLGHSTVTFTYNTYVHLLEEEKAKVMQEIDI